MSQFVHLHVHTQYSILDGASPIKGILQRAKELGMAALAITDHGNMFGTKEFLDGAKAVGVKPILGCEVYVVKNRFENDKDEKAGDHLILLAKNLTGYHNLAKIVSYSWTEGFYYKPRIDKTLLRKYSEGLICCSACLGGEVSQTIMKNDLEQASKVVAEFKEIFGDDYYLELQLHRSGDPAKDRDVYQNQLMVNREILKLAALHNVKYIASNDVHFVMEDDAPAHDRLICLNTGRDLDDPSRMRYTFQEYLKSPDQMALLFADNPEALATTVEIADKVEEYSLDHAPLMPNFTIPEDFVIDEVKLRDTFLKKIEDKELIEAVESCKSLEKLIEDKFPEQTEKLTIAKQYRYLEHISKLGAEKRYGSPLPDKIVERIDYELKTIEWMGFPGYFLIVWDFIKAAREMGVSVGPGRGSAAGSVVAYSLWITNIDPIKYDLLFERFLNPDRISLPDVDIDFDEDGRGEVLKYVIEKYGTKRVAQIITFGTMAPKMAIRDLARVQKLSLQESDRLAKLVPDRINNSKGETPFDRVYKDSPELAQERTSPNQLIRDTLLYAEKLEGSVRQTGVHACGVIIGPDDLENYIPMAIAKDADLNVVQYEGKLVESVGLIKMDFLGLKTLSIIKDAVENVEISKGIKIDIDAIPLDDKLTYELYSRGDTTGLFQFESPGMKKHLRNLKPNRLEDLIALNALYRPGPMDKIPSFVARKHGTEKVVYDIAQMEELLSDTYGITIYQEQVMLLSQKLANFTGGEADNLRKAMGKKQREVLDKMKPKFLAGVKANGHDPAICEKVWGEWEKFAEYAFNKSHATCYAYISYQTAYLKANYPAEFMAALLSRNMSDIKKLSFFMEECKRMGIAVLGPDVNESMLRFAADKKGDIRLGLAAIKGVGEAAVKNLVEERDANGPFTSIYDLVERLNMQNFNKKNIESLAYVGAFDNLTGFHRSKFFELDPKESEISLIEQLIRYGNRIQSEKNNSQQSLFGGDTGEVNIQKPVPPLCEEWTKLYTLTKEKELCGIYITSHPLDDYSLLINNFCNMTVSDLENIDKYRGKDFIIAGMVTDVQNLMTKSGKPYGRFTVEDYNGTYQFVLFSKDYETYRQYLHKDYYLLIRGKVVPKMYNEKEFEPRITSMMQLYEAQEKLIKEISITIPIDELTDLLSTELQTIVKKDGGKVTLRVRIVDSAGNVSLGFYSKRIKVNVSTELISFCEDRNFKYCLM